MKKKLKVRKNKAWGEFWSLKNVLKTNKLKLKTKMKILESCVLPVLIVIWCAKMVTDPRTNAKFAKYSEGHEEEDSGNKIER